MTRSVRIIRSGDGKSGASSATASRVRATIAAISGFNAHPRPTPTNSVPHRRHDNDGCLRRFSTSDERQRNGDVEIADNEEYRGAPSAAMTRIRKMIGENYGLNPVIKQTWGRTPQRQEKIVGIRLIMQCFGMRRDINTPPSGISCGMPKYSDQTVRPS